MNLIFSTFEPQIMGNIINIKDITEGTASNASGFSVYTVMKNSLTSDNKITLSFDGVNSMSSSFLNSSVGAFIDDYGFDAFKKNVSIINYTPSTLNMIKSYLKDIDVYA